MKTLKALIVSIVIFGLLSSAALAASFTSIGFIDVQRVFSEYKATEKAQKELSKEEESFKKDFEEKQKELEKAQKDEDLEKVEKLRTKLEKDLAPKREKLLRLNEELTTRLQQDILKSVQAVAEKVGVDVVLDKQVIITGGMDLTEMTLNELNK